MTCPEWRGVVTGALGPVTAYPEPMPRRTPSESSPSADQIVERVPVVSKELDFPTRRHERLGGRVVGKVFLATGRTVAQRKPNPATVPSVKRLEAVRRADRERLVHRRELRRQNVLREHPVLACDSDELPPYPEVPRSVIPRRAMMVVLKVVARVRDQEREVARVIDVEPKLILDAVRQLPFEEEACARHDEAGGESLARQPAVFRARPGCTATDCRPRCSSGTARHDSGQRTH